MYTTYWIVITWRYDRGVTWHVGWGLLILVATLLSLWALHLVNVKIKHFWFATWPLDRYITWLCECSPLILSHHPGEFVVRRPCESGNITSLITTWQCVRCFMWLFGWGSLILSHHSAKFGLCKVCDSGDITCFICYVNTLSKCHVSLWARSSYPKSPY